MRPEELKTPCALVDLDRLGRNCAQMAEKVSRLRATLRPHVKTHKCIEIAKIQTRGHSGAITVSTMAEARGFAAAGFDDITLAVPVQFQRIGEAAEFLKSGVKLNLLLDSEAALRELETCGRAQGVRFPAFLKVDCGYHRAGVDPLREESVSLAASLASSPQIEFLGLLTHAGHAYRA